MRRLSEQVVVVTGASSGVGRAIARAFGARGAKVGLVARTREGLERGAEEIRSSGGEALVLGYAAQQTGEPADPDRPDNVDRPIPGDRGAHGDFDARARRRSGELWPARHRAATAGVASAVAAALGVVAWRRA